MLCTSFQIVFRDDASHVVAARNVKAVRLWDLLLFRWPKNSAKSPRKAKTRPFLLPLLRLQPWTIEPFDKRARLFRICIDRNECWRSRNADVLADPRCDQFRPKLHWISLIGKFHQIAMTGNDLRRTASLRCDERIFVA